MTNLMYTYGMFDPYLFFAILGVALIILEVFIPGGVAGTVGAILLIFSAMVITDTMIGFLMFLFGFVILTALCTYLIYKLIPKEKLRKSLFLFSSLSKDEGYNSVKDMSEYKGCVGKTVSIMRPVGKVRLGNEIVDAVATNNFIEEGKIVEVIDVQASKIIVKEMEV